MGTLVGQNKKILSVTEVVRNINDVVGTLSPVLVEGEISSFREHAASGHWYFTIKDRTSQLDCSMWRNLKFQVKFNPAVGDKVWVGGDLNFYGGNGKLTLQAKRLVLSGAGDLYQQFQKLLRKLRQEGLFEDHLKRPIPMVPRTIGVVTGLQTAALRDVLRRLGQHSSYANVIVYPTAVQGEKAAEEIVRTIDIASDRHETDVLLLVRGGGSIEDLWCFNDERVARAIRRCSIPVITGIGHDSDQTIADFAADKMMPTPTAAAAAAATPTEQLLLLMAKPLKEIHKNLTNLLDVQQASLAYTSRFFESSESFSNQFRQKLVEKTLGFSRFGTEPLTARSRQLNTALNVFRRFSLERQFKGASNRTMAISHAVHSALVERQKQLKLSLPPLSEKLTLYKQQVANTTSNLNSSWNNMIDRRRSRLINILFAYGTSEDVENRAQELEAKLITLKLAARLEMQAQKSRFTFKLVSIAPKIALFSDHCRRLCDSIKNDNDKYIELRSIQLRQTRKNFRQLRPRIERKAPELAVAALRASNVMTLRMTASKLENLQKTLEAFSPQRILNMGYAMVERNGKIISKGRNLSAGQEINIVFVDKTVTARVEK